MKYLKMCPICGSINIKIPPAGMDFKMTKPDFCVDCGYRGIFPEVPLSELEEVQKKIKDENTKSNSSS